MKKNANLYYIALIITIFCSLSGWSNIININTKVYYALTAVSFMLFLFNMFNQKYTLKKLVIIIVLGLISLYTSYKLNTLLFMINFMAMISIENTDIKKIVKIDLIIKLFYILLHMTLYFINYSIYSLGIVDAVKFTENIGIRNSMFFTGPNAMAGLVFWLVIDYLYLNQNKKIYFKSLICIIPILLCYLFTKSRTFIIVYILYLTLLTFKKIFKKSDKLINIIFKYIPDILFITMLLIVSNYSLFINKFNMVITQINTLLSSRLTYSVRAYNYYGFNLLTNTSSINLEQKFIIDNFYIRSVVSYGVIIFLIISIITKMVAKKATSFEKIIIIIMYIYLFCELFAFDCGKTIGMLLLAYLLYRKKGDKYANS